MKCLSIKPKHTQCPTIISNFIRDILLPDYSKSAQDFFIHVLESQISYKNSKYVPVSKLYIRTYYRVALDNGDIKKLSRNGYLLITNYDRGRGLSREYSIPITLFNKIVNPYIKVVLNKRKDATILPTLIKYNKKDLGYYDDTRNYKSKLIVDAIRELFGIMNVFQALDIIEDKIENKTPDKQIYNDLRNIVQAEKKKYEYRDADDNLTYKPEYKISSTGRIYEVNYGIQNLSRDMKQELYGNREGFYNYDIRSSHLSALAQEASSVGIDISVIEKYIDSHYERSRLLYRCKMSKKLFKVCLLSKLYGSYYGENGTPYKLLSEEYGKEAAREKLELFKENVSHLMGVVTTWKRKLPKYLEERRYRARGKWYFKNAADIKIDLDSKKARDKNYMSSFIFQGLESSFIHHLTVLSKDYDYKPVSNEHDGLLTFGEIPEEAIERARDLSGFKNVILVEKNFC